ncbi:BCCT family transporter [Kocuria sp. M1R5S2]|uniref:BCCT family transporter n=1 Tax=Kocuria rhizosphaerae TaxID=3376285 RepID=UPI0037A75534
MSTPPQPPHESEQHTPRRWPGHRRKREQLPYPHGIHPALVPGIAVEDRKLSYGTDRTVFLVTAVCIAAFIAWGVLSTETLATASTAALGWVTGNTGWFFTAMSTLAVLFMLVVGFTKTGRIPLGTDEEEPEYSFFAWLAMLFAAGMGIGLMFFGASEPLNHFGAGVPGFGAAPGSEEMTVFALVQTAFHWALNPWAMYAVVGAAIAYGAYRRGRAPLISRIFVPLLGKKRAEGGVGKLIDIFAIFATLFGTAASLGIGAVQIAQGLQIVAGWGPFGNGGLIAIIAVLTAGFVVSAVSGIARGIRYLSSTNLILAFLLALFVFVAGPTVLLLDLVPAVFSTYLQEYLWLTGQTGAWGEETAGFAGGWTVFYWAWWLSWSPFVGMFIAKISRGRTLRQFVTVVLVVPSSMCVLWFIVMGGTAMHLQQTGTDLAGAGGQEATLFAMLDALPLSAITSVLAMLIIGIFFVTSADSASIVMGTLSQRGDPDPHKGVVIFWGLCLGGIAVVMLLAGGGDALTGMQNLVTVSALPFAVVVLLLMVAFYKELHHDPATIRARFASAAMRKAVIHGIEEHGDDFALQVEHAGGLRAAGEAFDSHDPVVTEWYRQVDEHGNEIEHVYKEEDTSP